MRLLPKKHFQWREPKPFLRRRDAAEMARLHWWFQPLAAWLTAAVGLVNWYVARFDPRKHPPSFSVAILIGVCGGLFFAYAMPWIIRWCPSEVRLYDGFLSRSRGNTHQRIKYTEIERFSWQEGTEYFALILRLHKQGREVPVGIPLEVSREAISEFLLERKIPQAKPKVKAPLEQIMSVGKR